MSLTFSGNRFKAVTKGKVVRRLNFKRIRLCEVRIYSVSGYESPEISYTDGNRTRYILVTSAYHYLRESVEPPVTSKLMVLH